MSDLTSDLADTLALFRKDVIHGLDAVGEKAMKDLVQKTKATAPKRSGRYRKAIDYKKSSSHVRESTWTWYVKAPFYRLTHLLVHGHALPSGGRTAGDPFLANALETVLDQYEKDVEEVVGGDR